MDPRVDEDMAMEEATADLREEAAEEEVAGGVDDAVRVRVLSVDAIVMEDSSREHSHPRSQGNKVASWMAATIRYCRSNN